MLKKLFYPLLLVLSGTLAFAAPVSRNDAKSAAVNWYKHYTTGSDYSIIDSIETKYGALTTFYTYIFNAGGFVMVSADDAVFPIIGCSVDERFDKNNIPSNAQYFFDEYSMEISKIIGANLDNTQTAIEWD